MIFLLYACGHIDNRAVIDAARKDSTAGAYIEGVPFFAQDEFMCGPASLASVIAYWGKDTGLEEVAKATYHDRLKGTLPVDMLIYAKDKGFEAEYYEGSLEDLKKRLSEGTPVILFLNLGYDFYPVGHYIVVVGYNERMRSIIAHSGMDREEAFTYARLEKAWSKTNRSTLLVRLKRK